MTELNKLYAKVRQETNEFMLDAIINVITSILIFFTIRTKVEITAFQIFIATYVLRMVHNVIHILFILVSKLIKY